MKQCQDKLTNFLIVTTNFSCRYHPTPYGVGFPAATIVSAIVSDFDAAKLAGAIVNTTTTILLLGINIFFATLQRRFDIIESLSYDAAVYIVNVVLFPVVAAGYLAVLSVDIIQYYRKRCPGEEE